MRQGRPILFIGQVLCGWVLLRAAMAWVPGAGAPPHARPHAPYSSVSSVIARPALPGVGAATPARLSAPAAGQPRIAPLPRFGEPARLAMGADFAAGGPFSASATSGGWSRPVADRLLASAIAFAQEPPGTHRLAFAAMAAGLRPAGGGDGVPGLASPPASAMLGGGDGQRGWSGSAWLLVRGAAAPAGAPMLGGSQAGLRVDRALAWPAMPSLRAHVRLSGPLATPLAEGALGLSARPLGPVPLALAVERRHRLGPGGRNGLAFYAAGGIDSRPLGAGLDVEGYAQGGIVGLPGADAFADGRLTIGRQIAGRMDRASLRLALGVEGAAQREAARLDLGPRIEARLPLPLGQAALRISGGWRERVAGAAAPASGPALVLVAGF